jgi:NADH-quinone oxidoreductase E subunit
MARLTAENVQRARDLIALYPRPRSALIPILHIAQEQDGWLTEEAMEHVAELVGITPAEVFGTASFYDMLFTEPVGTYLVSVCTNIACLLNGGYELLEHAEKSLGVKAGSTTADGQFTVEEVECIADCGRAPCLAVNWRFFGDLTPDSFDTLVADLRSGKLAGDVPPHGTLCRVRRDLTAWAGGLGSASGPVVSRSAPAQEASANANAGGNGEGGGQ